jgi:hypothetical protein
MTRALVRFLVPITLPAPDDESVIGWALLIGGLAIMAVGYFG